jgi:hypothetical protein
VGCCKQSFGCYELLDKPTLQPAHHSQDVKHLAAAAAAAECAAAAVAAAAAAV